MKSRIIGLGCEGLFSAWHFSHTVASPHRATQRAGVSVPAEGKMGFCGWWMASTLATAELETGGSGVNVLQNLKKEERKAKAVGLWSRAGAKQQQPLLQWNIPHVTLLKECLCRTSGHCHWRAQSLITPVSFMLKFTPTASLASPVNPALLTARRWGHRRTRRKPTRPREEQANATQEGPGQGGFECRSLL